MDKVSVAIKAQLETTYDIPFHVESGNEYRDSYYKIWPDNDLGELFEIKMLYRQRIRLIIEVFPQKYAAGMISDMNNADGEKIGIFLKYIDVMQKKQAKVEMSINNNLCKSIDENLWQHAWKSLKFRISVIPEKDDEEDYEKMLFISWAKHVVGMMLALLNIEKMETEDRKYAEGGLSQILTNKYERNPANRQLCLMANGYVCKICGFDFEREYGEIGHEFIHVHHIDKISSFDKEYYLNPEEDLIPVCPNCHAMLHREDPPLRPEELVAIINAVHRDRQGE